MSMYNGMASTEFIQLAKANNGELFRTQ